MLRLDKIFQMDRCESSLSREGEEIQEVSLITPVLISLDMFKKEGGSFKSLRDLEMIITQIFIVGDILRPDPGRFQELYRVRQFSIKAEVTRVLKITVVILLSFAGSMAILRKMLII